MPALSDTMNNGRLTKWLKNPGDRVKSGEAVAEVVGKSAGKNLSLVLEAAEGAGVNHAIAVALKIAAIGVGKFGITSSRRATGVKSQAGQH